MYQIDLTGKWTELPQIYQLSIFYRASMVAQLVKNPVQRPQFKPWVGKIPWRREWLPTPVFFSGGLHGQRSLAGYSEPGGLQSMESQRIWHDWVSNTFTFKLCCIPILFLICRFLRHLCHQAPILNYLFKLVRIITISLLDPSWYKFDPLFFSITSIALIYNHTYIENLMCWKVVHWSNFGSVHLLFLKAILSRK